MLWRQIIGVSLLALILGSCDNPNDLGMDLLPTSDIIDVGSHVEKNSNKSYIFLDDIIRTSSQSNESQKSLLGSMNDPVFGQTSIDYACQLLLENYPDFSKNAVIDSFFLYLYYHEFYGDTITTQKLKIYELEESLDIDHIYYNTEDLSSYASSQPIAEFEFIPKIKYDTTSTDSATLTQLLRIPINYSLAQKLMSADSLDMVNNEVFLQFFKGIYIKPEPVSLNGSLIKLETLPTSSFNGSALVIHYHNDEDTLLTAAYLINKYSARINSFKHDYSNTPFYSKIDREDVEDSLIYIQPTAGLKSKIYIPEINNWIKDNSGIEDNNWKNNENIVINRAIVEFQIDSIASEMEKYKVPSQLLLKAIDENGASYMLADSTFSPAFYDGYFNQYTNTYTFNITQHFKSIIEDGVSNNGFYLSVANRREQANRVILKGAESSVGIKFLVTYSKVSL